MKSILEPATRTRSVGPVRWLSTLLQNGILSLAVLAGLVAAIYASTLAALVLTWWRDPGASHGFLIPPVALYAAWLRRGKLASLTATPDARGLWLLGLGCAVFLTGKIGVGFFLRQVSFLIVIAGIIAIFWGFRRLRLLLFPLVLLATMIPLPSFLYDNLSAPLQIFASTVSTSLAQAFGVTVYREGNQIHLAQISLGIEEACSGLRSLSALVIAALLMGTLYSRRLSGRMALLLLAVPIAIGVNVLRITSTAILADYRVEWAMGFYHSFSGWLIFLVGSGLLWASAKGLQFVFPPKS